MATAKKKYLHHPSIGLGAGGGSILKQGVITCFSLRAERHILDRVGRSRTLSPSSASSILIDLFHLVVVRRKR